MIGKTVVITGAAGGLGRAVSRLYAKAGATVVLLDSDPFQLDQWVDAIESDVLQANVEGVVADLGDMDSVREAATEIKANHPLVHVLINNAAVYKAHRVTVAQGLEMMFAVNQLGPFLLTHLLLNNLQAAEPSRILNVTAPSTTPLAFDDLQGEKKFGALKAFSASKMANLLFTYELARRLEGSGVTANAYFPGLMRTKLLAEMPAPVRLLFHIISKSPERAAEGLLYLGTSPEMEKASGKMFKYGSEIQSNAYSHDLKLQKRLWNQCARLAGVAG